MISPDSQMGQPTTSCWFPVPEGRLSISTWREPGVEDDTKQKSEGAALR